MFPRRWIGPAAIINQDLELVDDDDVDKLDRSLLDLLVARRDQLKSSSGKFSLLNISLFAFLVTNYFNKSADVSVYGVSIKSSPGVAEALIVISSTLGIHVATIQGNIAIIDGAIAHIIKRIFPTGILNIMQSALVPETSIGKYFPINLPHLVFTSGHSLASKSFVYFYLFIILVAIFGVYIVNLLLLRELWLASSIGIYSKIVVIYVVVCGLFGGIFLFLTRLPSPYRDFTVLHELQIAEQLNPVHASKLWQRFYKAKIDDRSDLERRGFIGPKAVKQG
jgi:hypothetical protein